MIDPNSEMERLPSIGSRSWHMVGFDGGIPSDPAAPLLVRGSPTSLIAVPFHALPRQGIEIQAEEWERLTGQIGG